MSPEEVVGDPIVTGMSSTDVDPCLSRETRLDRQLSDNVSDRVRLTGVCSVDSVEVFHTKNPLE